MITTFYQHRTTYCNDFKSVSLRSKLQWEHPQLQGHVLSGLVNQDFTNADAANTPGRRFNNSHDFDAAGSRRSNDDDESDICDKIDDDDVYDELNQNNATHKQCVDSEPPWTDKVHNKNRDEDGYKNNRKRGVNRRKLYNAVKAVGKLPIRALKRTRKRKNETQVVSNVHELWDTVLKSKIPLRDIAFNLTDVQDTVSSTTVTIEQLSNHPVIRLIANRTQTNSTPSKRAPYDKAHLSLSVEGGGIRGAVNAGMATAITSLGMLDAFDSIYGSSAGAVIGAYMISRQMCMDIYTDIMPEAKRQFASKGRIFANLGVDIVDDWALSAIGGGGISDEDASSSTARASTTTTPMDNIKEKTKKSVSIASGKIQWLSRGAISRIVSKVPYLFIRPVRKVANKVRLSIKPGMNVTFVLEGIMSKERGLRPFDLEAFRINDAKQPLRIVSSTVRGCNNSGKNNNKNNNNNRMSLLETVAFSSSDGDFFGIEEEVKEGDIEWSGSKRSYFVWLCMRPILAIKNLAVSAGNIGLSTLKATAQILFYPFKRIEDDRNKELKAVMKGREARTSQRRREGVSGEEEIDAENNCKVNSDTMTTLLPPGSKAMRGLVSSRMKKMKQNDKKKIRFREATSCPDNANKKGFFACLEASMLYPGAVGPPIKLVRSKYQQSEEVDTNRKKEEKNINYNNNVTNICFDAFCYESIPYRSAVENGATHVLALRSRPDGCTVDTKLTVYEASVAPVYFRLNKLDNVAEFFKRGGSQYRYIEDVMVLDEGLRVGCTNIPVDGGNGNNDASLMVKVPPTEILYGTNNDSELVIDTDCWNRAHLLPVAVPAKTPELSTIEQDKDVIIQAVRNGFAAAFNMLAPFSGFAYNRTTIDGLMIAKKLFPKGDEDENTNGSTDILQKPVAVKGEVIDENYFTTEQNEDDRNSKSNKKRGRRTFYEWFTSKRDSKQPSKDTSNIMLRDPERVIFGEAEALLAALPVPSHLAAKTKLASSLSSAANRETSYSSHSKENKNKDE